MDASIELGLLLLCCVKKSFFSEGVSIFSLFLGVFNLFLAAPAPVEF
jgi:hypothetical protein